MKPILFFLSLAACSANIVFAQQDLNLDQFERLRFVVDVGAVSGPDLQAAAGCATQPFTHDARIWSVIAQVEVPVVGGVTREGVLNYFQDPARNLVVVYLDGPEDTLSITNKGRSHPVRLQNIGGQVRLEIPSLTLAEISDVVEAITENRSLLGSKLSEKGYTLKILRVSGTDANGATVTIETLQDAFLSGIDPVEDRAALLHRMEALLLGETELRTTPALGSVAVKARATLLRSMPVSGAISLDDQSITTLRTNVELLGKTGGAQRADNQPQAPGTPPLFMVDEPCLGLSIAPVVSGANQSLAATFRLRYDVFSPDGKSFLKLRAEGDGDAGGSYFNRAEGKVDLGLNWKPQANNNALVVSGGAVAGYAFTRISGHVVDEWSAAGKFQISLPPLLFRARGGSLARPLLSVEGGAAGGNRLLGGGLLPVSKTEFVSKGTFQYSVRATDRATIDLSGAAGASASEFFNGRKYFSNVRLQARFNLTKDFDFLARYDCGRRSPDYVKFCGWQTGMVLVNGR